MQRFNSSALRDQLRVLLLRGADRHALTPSAVDELAAQAIFNCLGPMEPLFGIDDQTDFVAFNVVGIVRLLCPGPERPRTLMYVKPGEFVLTGRLFEGFRCRRAFVAVGYGERTTVAIWGETTVSKVLAQLPGNRSAQVMSCALSATTGVLRDRCLMLDMPLAPRLLFALKLLARSFGERHPRAQDPPLGVLITLELTCDEIADLVIATRAPVTKALGLLKNLGLIDRVGRSILITHKGLGAPLNFTA